MHSKEKQRSRGPVTSTTGPLYTHSSTAMGFPSTDATKTELVLPVSNNLSRTLVSIDSHSLLGFRHVDVFLNAAAAMGVGWDVPLSKAPV